MNGRSTEFKSVRMGFLTVEDARDVRTWSGTPHFMAKGLEKHFGKIELLGPLSSRRLRAYKLFGAAVERLSGRRYLPLAVPAVAREIAAIAKKRVAEARPDVVFWPAGSVAAGQIPTDTPLIYSSDATFNLIDGYHPRYRNLTAASRRGAHALEASAIRRADLIIYPTEWAARSARDDYGADPDRIHVIPYGANLGDPPDRQSALRPRDDRQCGLLFVGGNWHEKGADIALGTLRALREMGVNAELTICGCTPPASVDSEGLTILPFLDKSKAIDFARLNQCFLEADFLLVPTRADCFGIVFCEASAYGVPSIATDTGGVSCVVREGINGHTLPFDAGPETYAALIAEIFVDRERYMALKTSSRDLFEELLNWDVWARTIARLTDDLIGERGFASSKAEQ